MIDMAALEKEEDGLRSRVTALPDNDRRRFYEEIKPLIRDPDTYAALNYSLIAGLHHFYLGRWQRGAADLIVMALGILLLFLESLFWVGVTVLVVLALVELFELFRSQQTVMAYNNQVMKDTLERYSGTEIRSADTRPGF